MGNCEQLQVLLVLLGHKYPTMGNCDQLQGLLVLLKHKFPTMGNHIIPVRKVSLVCIETEKSDCMYRDPSSYTVPHNWELWTTSSFAFLAWTQVPHNGKLWPTSRFASIACIQEPHDGEPHYPSPKSQTVYIETCLPIQSDFSGCDKGSPQWGTVTNFKFCLYCLNKSSQQWGTTLSQPEKSDCIYRELSSYTVWLIRPL